MKQNKPSATGKAAKVDWEAVERDFATGRYTDRELGELHAVSREAVVRKRKRDQAADPRRWQRDLTEQVRVTTHALLLQEEVTAEAAKPSEDHSSKTAIMVAAEIGKRVILSHRAELRSAKDVAAGLLQELKASALLVEHSEALAMVLAGAPEDMGRARAAVHRALGLGSRVSSIKALAEALTKLHAAERVAFALEDRPAEERGGLGTLVGQMQSALGVVRNPPPDDDA